MVNENLTTQKSKKVPDWLNSAIWSTPPQQPPPPPSSTTSIDPYDPPYFRPDGRHNSDGVDDNVYDSPPPSALPKPRPSPKADSNGTSTSNGSDSIAAVSTAPPTPEDISRHAQLLVEDTEIIEQIDRDVKRTHPDMQFFSGDTSLAKSNQESLRSILIVFAKLNPGIRYVQGMNEVLAPLFYVFRNDPDENYVAAAESDTFFCFVELIGGLRDNFCQQLDNSAVGIRSTITKLSLLLKEHDEELWRHLEVTCKVNPQFYAFRWITLLLTQEFSFTDILHIWDTLLSDSEGPQESLLRICCAMLILIRRRLLAGDFTSNLKLLQHYPSTNISHLMYVASKLRAHPGS